MDVKWSVCDDDDPGEEEKIEEIPDDYLANFDNKENFDQISEQGENYKDTKDVNFQFVQR